MCGLEELSARGRERLTDPRYRVHEFPDSDASASRQVHEQVGRDRVHPHLERHALGQIDPSPVVLELDRSHQYHPFA